MREPTHNRQTLNAFIARKAEIDSILARLSALSDEHFNTAPEDVTWADVSTLGSYLSGLRRVSDAAFHKGEHAG
jgi:hypothetical protein